MLHRRQKAKYKNKFMDAITLNKDLQQHKTMIFQLDNMPESRWIRKGTEKTSNPVPLGGPSRNVALPIRSTVSLGPGRGMARIMYSPYASTIFLDDLWLDKAGDYHALSEMKQEGWTKEPGLLSIWGGGETADRRMKEEYRIAVGMNIAFEYGTLDLFQYGDDPTLRRFVEFHHRHTEAPHAELRPPSYNRMFNYHRIDKAGTSEKKLAVTLDAKVEALEYVGKLRRKEKGVIIYDEGKIDATINRFGMGGPESDLETYPQKMEVIFFYADREPASFMEIINQQNDEVKVFIISAIEHKVLSFVKKEVMVHDKTSRKICDVKSTNTEDQILELTTFFYTKKGESELQNAVLLVEEAKKKSV